ncbi:hypothetical protein KP509_34G068700 [Ceratopteris richardii]|uniref:Uncharacterized protein n=1 Tax=Ceratopteris richardii TaxID=49495 RepID=A0A8T2QL30_CERRI|nr:hypothetical protein KP509_34G068700 [Ceratopteris richardii]
MATRSHQGYEFDFDADGNDYGPLASPTERLIRSQHLSASINPQPWSTGICACFNDMKSCCLGLWCPCILFGRNVEVLEGRPWTGPCLMHALLLSVAAGIGYSLTHGTLLGLLVSCVPCYACGYRKILRTKYNLEDAPCGDFLTHLCCHQCALCQEYREIYDKLNTDSEFSLVPPSSQTMEGHLP